MAEEPLKTMGKKKGGKTHEKVQGWGFWGCVISNMYLYQFVNDKLQLFHQLSNTSPAMLGQFGNSGRVAYHQMTCHVIIQAIDQRRSNKEARDSWNPVRLIGGIPCLTNFLQNIQNESKVPPINPGLVIDWKWTIIMCFKRKELLFIKLLRWYSGVIEHKYEVFKDWRFTLYMYSKYCGTPVIHQLQDDWCLLVAGFPICWAYTPLEDKSATAGLQLGTCNFIIAKESSIFKVQGVP